MYKMHYQVTLEDGRQLGLFRNMKTGSQETGALENLSPEALETVGWGDSHWARQVLMQNVSWEIMGAWNGQTWVCMAKDGQEAIPHTPRKSHDSLSKGFRLTEVDPEIRTGS